MPDSHNETQVRREFIDPLFEALGWDVPNASGTADSYKDVIHEDSVKISGATKAPDYSFRAGGLRRFFVEAKRPSRDLETDPAPAFQLRRYAWSAKLPLSVLTDFEEFAVYDGRVEPAHGDGAAVARIAYYRYEDFEARWDEIAGTFSKQAVLDGSFDAYAEEATSKRGTDEVDKAFLRELESWRQSLASAILSANRALTPRQLNFSVQRTIDRIVFLRICEDRGIEPYGQLQQTLSHDNAYAALVKLFHHADARYNSGLFQFRKEAGREEAHDTLTPALAVPDEVLQEIVRRLYYPESPYEFSVLPADILGQAYEQFLGSVIVARGGEVQVEPKPEVKKAGGVYYTPTYVVDHIVADTVGRVIEGRTPRQVGGDGRSSTAPLRILDPACGSGSFLIGAYQYLLDWYRDAYVIDPAQWTKGRSPRLYQSASGEWRLTGRERRWILLRHIFGVDIDPQTVEVTKLSLLLKVLEGESLETLTEQMTLFHERALPDLGNNIKCGNSLIGTEFLRLYPGTLFDEEASYHVNAFDWARAFADVLEADADGFDAVIGNPPYVLLQDGFEDTRELEFFREQYRVASYKVDTYHLFIEKGLELTRPGGFFSMITPSNFLTNNYLAELRRVMLEDSTIQRILVIDGGVFDGISVDNAIFNLTPGASTTGVFPVAHATPHAGQLAEQSTTLVRAEGALATKHVLFTGSAEPEGSELWDSVFDRATTLGAIAHVNFGKQLRDRTEYPDDVIKLDEGDSVPAGYRECLTGRDVSRYSVGWGHLACLDDRVAKRGGCWDDTRQNAKSKLLTRQIGRHPEWALDDVGRQCLNTMFMVQIHDAAYSPLYVLALLNSSVLRAFWLDRYFDQRRTFPKIKGTYLKELPIWPSAEVSDAQRKALEDLARQVIDLRHEADEGTAQEQEVRARRIAALESQIDDLVIHLYGVTDEQRAKLAA